VTDVDGVLTDGGLYYAENGEELSSEVVDEGDRRRTLLGEVAPSTPKPRWQPGERYATHVGGYHHEGGGVGQ